MPTGVMAKRPCAMGCGKLLDPRGAHKHERTCDGAGGGRALPAKRGAHSVARKATKGDGTASGPEGPTARRATALGAARITVELQAMMEDCRRAIELVGLAARRIEERHG